MNFKTVYGSLSFRHRANVIKENASEADPLSLFLKSTKRSFFFHFLPWNWSQPLVPIQVKIHWKVQIHLPPLGACKYLEILNFNGFPATPNWVNCLQHQQIFWLSSRSWTAAVLDHKNVAKKPLYFNCLQYCVRPEHIQTSVTFFKRLFMCSRTSQRSAFIWFS